jgi:hypothetical protein
MSKHVFKGLLGGKIHSFQLGWDRPMCAYYFDVFPYTKECHCKSVEEIEACQCIGEPVTTIMSPHFDDISKMMKDLARTPPEKLYENMKNDRKRNIVNEFKFYEGEY